MRTDIIHNISYLIGYRQSTPDRKAGLQFVLNWLHTHFPELEILLIEQDENSNLDFDLPPNCQHHFIYNPGLYNRCWAFNVGVKLTQKDILAFADSDMFLHPEDFMKGFEACQKYEAVNPNGSYTYNIINTNHEALTYDISERRKLWTYAAGLMFMQRAAFERIGGWDERFEGWGVEDNEISHIILNSLSYTSLNYKMYHVDHVRGVFDGKTQPKYIYNRSLYDEISLLYGPSLERYVEIRRGRDRGDAEKYRKPAEQAVRKLRFVMAVIPAGNLSETENLLQSWRHTFEKDATWTLIISNDRPDRRHLDFLNSRDYDGIEKIILEQAGETHIQRYNSVIRLLESKPFDLCFFCRESLTFLKPGWDTAYWHVIERTGAGHLCFRGGSPEDSKCILQPAIRGALACYSSHSDLQHAFYTMIPDMISQVGYLDSAVACDGKTEFSDYSLRSFRKGFNVFGRPFDLNDSHEFLIINPKTEYVIRSAFVLEGTVTDEQEVLKRQRLIQQNRTYIPYNDHLPYIITDDIPEEKVSVVQPVEIDEPPPSYAVKVRKGPRMALNQLSAALNKEYYARADAGINLRSGFPAILAGLVKKSYNLMFVLRLSFVIRCFDRLANFLIRAGAAFKNIDYKKR